MADLDFLTDLARGDAVLLVFLPDSSVSRIHGVCPYRILDRCPLLYHAFEFGQGINQASIEASSLAVAAAFLRFLYTGNYLADGDENAQSSILTHAEMCKLADDFDVPELQVQAYVNFMRETELSCSLPRPPIGLCEAIRLVYKRPAKQQSLIDTLLNYCIFAFAYHGLGENPEFRQVAVDTPLFVQGLCRTNMKRGFEDEAATEVISFCNSISPPSPTHSKRTIDDVQYEFFAELDQGDASPDSKLGDGSTKRLKQDTKDVYMLVHRSKNQQPVSTVSDYEPTSEVEGFMLVHRPKLSLDTQTGKSSSEGLWASPEPISAPTSDGISDLGTPIGVALDIACSSTRSPTPDGWELI